MISLFRKVIRLTSEHLGCGDCTMLASWRTAAIQKPHKCKLGEFYAYCPMTGELLYDWELVRRELLHVYVDEDSKTENSCS